MKKILAIGLLLSLVAIGGCGQNTVSDNQSPKPLNNSVEKAPPAGEITPPSQGITVNKINFQTLSELPDGIQDKTQRGFLVNKLDDGYEIVIFAGEKRTSGYGIEVSNVEDNEGKTIIYVNETSPGKNDMVGQVITYPTTAIKIGNNIAPNFVVTTTDGNRLSQLN